MDPCPVLIGREQEMAALRKLLDAGGGVAVVSGEAGIGKSRLVREFAAEAAQRGRVVLWGRPEEVAQPGPYALIADLIESIVEHGNSNVKRDARALETDLISPADHRPVPSARSVAAELRGLIANLGQSPLVVVEDLHWADELSHSALLPMSRAARDDGHLIVLSMRTEGAVAQESLTRLTDALARDRIATPLILAPLSDQEIGLMLELIWSRPPREDELREYVRLGEGVPFFVEELAELGPEGLGAGVPRSIEQSVQARVRELDEGARDVVRTASLLAGALDSEVLAIACDLPLDAVAGHLSSAAQAGLLEDVDGRLLFRHALVRQAIAASLVSVDTRQRHSRLAFAIEKIYSEELDQFSGALAQHHREAGDRQVAAEYAVRAGERALALAAVHEARSAFGLALELSDDSSIEAILGLAETEFRDGNESEAARLFERASSALIRKGQTRRSALALGRLAWALQGRVASSDVLAVLDSGLELLAQERDSPEYVKLMVQKGGMLTFVLNRHDEARPILEDAARLAEEVRDQALVAEALDGLAQIADSEGQWQEELSLGARAIGAAAQSESAEVIGRTHNNHAVCLSAVGEPKKALTVLADGRAMLERAYGPAAVGALNVTRAWIAMLMGLPNEVDSLTAATGVSWQRWRSYRRFLEVWAASQMGDLKRARSVLDAAWAEVGGEAVRRSWIETPEGPNPDASQVLRAEVFVLLGEPRLDEALASAHALVDVDTLGSERFELGHSLAMLALLLLMSGDRDASFEVWSRLNSLADKHNYLYLQAFSAEIAGTRESSSGEPAKAMELFARAISLFDRCDNAADQARCEREWSASGLDAGHERAEIEPHLRRARQLAQESGAWDELHRIDALLRSIGIRPRAGRPRKDAGASAGGLSPRESEVVALVAAGSTNFEIAQRLFLSERTVQDHVTHALKKLDLPGRAALASWAVRQGMI